MSEEIIEEQKQVVEHASVAANTKPKRKRKLDRSKIYDKITDQILEAFKQDGHKPYDVARLNGYFVITFGRHSVVQFKLKDCKRWTFGIWFESDKDKYPAKITASIFAQYDRFIDKFKPTASTFVSELVFLRKMSWINKHNDWSFMLASFGMIWKHPYLAIYRDIAYIDYNETYLSPIIAFFKVHNCIMRDIKYDCKRAFEEFLDMQAAKRWARKHVGLKHKPIIGEWELIDGNTKDWKVSPRYRLTIALKKDISDADIAMYNKSFEDSHSKLAHILFKQKWYGHVAEWIHWMLIVGEKKK